MNPQLPDFNHLPEHERPVNVGAINAPLIDRELSNFEQAPFVLDGRRFESVEGFYVWLKWSGDADKQATAQKLYSYEAKKFGKRSTNSFAEYDGRTIQLGSDEHHELLKRAIQAKLEQHSDIARRFVETHPRSIIHDFGHAEPPSRFPAQAFVRILTELRDDLLSERIVTVDGPISALISTYATSFASAVTYPVSEYLRTIQKYSSLREHPINRYIEALEDSPKRVTRLIHGGSEFVVLEMPGNRVLKIGTRLLPEMSDLRQFHLHFAEVEEVDAGFGLKLQCYIQPKAKSPVTSQQLRDLRDEMKRQGWIILNAAENQVGEYHGGIKLLDPYNCYRITR